MKKSAAALAAFFLTVSAASADETLLSNGSPDKKLDLVFLGDGYTEPELSLYRDDVRRFTDHLFSQPPFSEHQDLFNVHRVDIVSPQSGTDDSCAGTSVTTALDAGFFATGTDCRLLYTYSGAKVYQAASRAPGYDPGAGLVVVIVNSVKYGGAASAGGYAVVNRGPSGPEAMAHELGHSFGLLADEYDQAGRTYTSGEPSQPNVTIERNLSLLKWARWIAAATPIPTTALSIQDVPGLYEGAMNFAAGIFRPTFDSKMRTLNRPYERVNAGLLTERMDALLPPTIEILSPAPGLLASQRVSVSGRGEDGVDLARMELWLDGKEILPSVAGKGPRWEARWEWDASSLSPGPHTMSVRALDRAGNTAMQTQVVVIGNPDPPAAMAEDRSGRPLLLSPGLRDGMNDDVDFGEDAVEVSVFNASGHLVHSGAGNAPWNAGEASSGMYVARVTRRDGSKTDRALLVIR